jgi:hypothetical protein
MATTTCSRSTAGKSYAATACSSPRAAVLPSRGSTSSPSVIGAHIPLDVLGDTIQPFPTFSEIYVAALKALRGEIATARQPIGAGPPWRADGRTAVRGAILTPILCETYLVA